MDSFAENNITFEDGQSNKQSIPDEIQKYGFKPPVRSQDGSIQSGDSLAANHLNYILNDLYSKISAIESKINSGG